MAVANMEGTPAERFAFGGFFPVKRLKSKFSSTEGGEWLVAYRAEQRRRLRAVLSAFPESSHTREGDSCSDGQEEGGLDDSQRGVHSCLNKEFVLRHLHVDSPSDVVEVNIAGCGLSEGEPEDLGVFAGVVKVVASENKLPLELFDSFKCLNELEASLNGITKVEVTRESFKQLQVLDLSYNSVCDQGLLALGTLPVLKELHLTGNSLVVLPLDMSRPFVDAPQLGQAEVFVRFPYLEKLWLDENQLTDMSTFAVLAGLKRLKELYLDSNELYGVPQLRLLGVNTVDESPSLPSTRDGCLSRDSVFTPVVETRGESSGGGGGGGATSTEGARREADDTPQPPPTAGAGQQRKQHHHLAQLPPPFPLLEMLSLANNLILRAESLVPLKVWPRLKQLRIQGNPLTFTCKGMPSVLQQELVEGRGVGVIRRASELRKKSHPSLAEKSKELKKIPSSLPPLIPKPPLPLPLEAGPSQHAMMALGPPQLPAIEGSQEDSSDTPAKTSEQQCPKEKGSPSEGLESAQSGVFLTQVDVEDRSAPGVPSEESLSHSPPHSHQAGLAVSETVQSEFDRRRRGEREKWKHLPSRYKGYEALLSAVPDANVVVPKDLQACSMALRHLLKHTVTLPNPRAVALSSNTVNSPLQVTQRLQGVELAQDGRHQGSELQVQATFPQKVRQLEEVLSEIKHQCLEIDISLTDILSTHEQKSQLKATKNVHLEREANLLLEEVQKKVDDLRRSVAKCDPQNRPVPPTLQEEQ